MRHDPVNRRKPAVVSVRSVRANGMTVLVSYRGMTGPIQVQGNPPETEFPLIVTGATDPQSGEGVAAVITGWHQITSNTVEVSFNVLVKGLPYEYVDHHPNFLAFPLALNQIGLPITGKKGTVG